MGRAMPKSKLQLYNRVLEVLVVKASGNPASMEDIDLVEASLAPLLAELNAMDVANIGVHPTDRTSEDIEDFVFHPLADLLANEVASPFGGQTLTGDARQVLINRIRRVFVSGPSYFSQEAQYL